MEFIFNYFVDELVGMIVVFISYCSSVLFRTKGVEELLATRRLKS